MIWGPMLEQNPQSKNKTGKVHMNVTLTRARVTTVASQKQEILNILMYVCTHIYPARKAQTP
jgi:hypothetical protein